MPKPKTVLAIIMIIVITLSLISCAKKKQIIFVNASDSLGWQDDLNYNLRVKNFAVDDDEIMVLNDGEPSVFIYDRESKNFIKSFGDDGDGPGEFRSSIGIASFNNRYWVSESSPLRIQSFSRDLTDVDCYKGHFAMWFLKDQNNLYGQGLFNCGVQPILQYQKDDFIPLFEEEKFLKDNGLSRNNMDPVYRLNMINGKLIMVYCVKRELFLFDEEFKRIDVNFENPDLLLNEKTIFGRVEAFNDGFLLPVVTDREDETSMTLVYYDISGKIVDYYQLNMQGMKISYLWSGINVWENYVFLYDENTGYIYEFEL